MTEASGTSRRASLLAIVAVVIAADLVALSLWFRDYRWSLAMSSLAPIAGVLIMKRVGQLSFAQMGLKLLPRHDCARWLRVLLMTGACAVWAIAIVYAALALFDRLPNFTDRRMTWQTFWKFHVPIVVVHAPLCEELIFRVLLCTALRSWIGDRGNIIISGTAFGAMHVYAGNAAPNNVLAGFLFAWLFLKSGTWVVPLAFHAIGNLIVGLLGLAIAYG